MRCPVDEHPLVKRYHHEPTYLATYHVCGKCHGIWFSRKDLIACSKCKRFRPKVPIDPELDLAGPPPGSDGHYGRPCPTCDGKVLDVKHIDEVEIDQCPGCEGVWLDAGEFDRVRSWYARNSRSGAGWIFAADATIQAATIVTENASAGQLEAAIEVLGELLAGIIFG